MDGESWKKLAIAGELSSHAGNEISWLTLNSVAFQVINTSPIEKPPHVVMCD